MHPANPWDDPNQETEAKKYQNPIPSRLLILQTVAQFCQEGLACTAETLATRFEILGDEDKFFALSNRLKAMLRDNQLLRDDGIHLRIAPLPQSVTGKVVAKAQGFGFLLLEDASDLFLHEKQMRLVFHGDTAQAIATEFRGKPEGRIEKVLQRHQTQFVGTLAQEDDHYYLKLDGVNAHQPIGLATEDVRRHNLALGAAAKARITQWPSYAHFACGEIVQTLDALNDRERVIETAIANYNLPSDFDDDALKQAQQQPDPKDVDLGGRVDLRDLALVTIDGEDSRDFDDAVFAQKRAGGHFRLIVAIADVGHYVKAGSPLDKVAFERGTSVYFPHHVIPMLPEILSNGLCSLNPHADRLCMVADIKISAKGKVTDCVFYNAVMRSAARLTYNQVNAYFDDPTNETLPRDLVENPQVGKSIDTLHRLYQILAKKRAERGAMEFETPESLIKFGKDGDIVAIETRSRGDAQKLIEECMLLANTCAAQFALKRDLPVLYRNHESPDDEKAARLAHYLQGFGLPFPSSDPSHDDYWRVIDAIRDRPDAPTIHGMLLRSMMQANYSPNNGGHFGLAYKEYAHFTSPIRRYPDLLLHRALKDHLAGKKPDAGAVQRLAKAGEQSSITERRAEEASRFVESWLKCLYMRDRVGEEFAGVVSSVTAFGLFVTLSDVFIDGLVRIAHLGDEYFEYDEKQQKLIGNQGRIFSLGDALRVQVAGVNMDLLQIDFALLNQNAKRKSQKRKKRKKKN